MLYEILGLPVRKLASKDAIKRAFRLQSLRYHPDRVLPEEAEEAAEKFVAVKAAYELLLEGMETGGDLGGAVFSGGDLAWAGMPADAAPPPPDGLAAAASGGAAGRARRGGRRRRRRAGGGRRGGRRRRRRRRAQRGGDRICCCRTTT